MKNYKRSAIDRDVTFRPPVHNCYACNDTGIVHNSDGLINNYLGDYDITESGKRVAGSDLAIICYCEAVYPKYNEEAQLTGHGFRDGEGNIRNSVGINVDKDTKTKLPDCLQADINARIKKIRTAEWVPQFPDCHRWISKGQYEQFLELRKRQTKSRLNPILANKASDQPF